MSSPIRLTAVMTHPVQYYSPWFRFIEREAPELALTVLYVSEPSPSQQGAQFGTRFTWDVPLREGYESRVLRPSRGRDEFGSDRFWGLDAPRLGAEIASTRPDAVLLSGWHSMSLMRALVSCSRRGIPLVYRGDTFLSDRVHSWMWRTRTRFLLGRFDRYLAVGSRTREYLSFFGVPEGSVHDSPHAVDNGFFAARARPFRDPAARAEARAERGICESAFVALFVGKLEPKKRVGDLLRALAMMNGSPVLVVIGTGPLEPEHRELAATLEVDVRWCGFCNQSELGRAYGIADCLVLPSDWGETWGLVVNEAMASGLPCVVSDRVGCAPDLVLEGRTGETFPCGDVAGLARAIERIRDGDARTSACERHVSRFSFRDATRGLVSACLDAVT